MHGKNYLFFQSSVTTITDDAGRDLAAYEVGSNVQKALLPAIHAVS